ncbi:MAG: hypothetical protein NVSMB14_05660 [Isosphaeraceae bacterium]
MSAERSPILSIVIPSFNGRPLLATCLASIVRARPDPKHYPLEIIVADDASNDDTAPWLAANHPEVRLIRLKTNGGFVLAANAGIEAARGAFIQLLNNDTEVAPGWVEAGLKPFSDPRIAAVAPLTTIRSRPDLVDSAGDSYDWFGRPYKRGRLQAVDLWSGRDIETVDAASASSAIYRARVLQLVGGFDPIFGSYYEDVDLSLRIRLAGFRCVFASDCRIAHDVSATYDHSRPALQRRLARNAEILFWCDLPLGRLLLSLPLRIVFLIAQTFQRLLTGRIAPFLLGKLDALRLSRVLFTRRRRLIRESSRKTLALDPASTGF